MELWGGKDTKEESELLDELQNVLVKIMQYGHEKPVALTGFVLTMSGVSEEYDGHLHTSTNMRGQTLEQGRYLTDLMEARMKRLEAGAKV